MVKPGRVRRDKQRRVAGRRSDAWADVVGPAPDRELRTDGSVSVQLLPHHLASGELPRLAVGDELEVAPVIFVGHHTPSSAPGDEWRNDHFGTIAARGTVLTSPLSPTVCDCLLDVLDAGGTLFPLNWAITRPGHGRIQVDGGVYLDPELSLGAPDDGHADSVVLCRRRRRVRGLRRYALLGGQLVAPVALDAGPRPAEVSDEVAYVADLELVDDELG